MKKISIPYSALKDVPVGWFVAVACNGWVATSRNKPFVNSFRSDWYAEGKVRKLKQIFPPNSWNKHLWQRIANNGNAKDFERVEI